MLHSPIERVSIKPKGEKIKKEGDNKQKKKKVKIRKE